MALKIDWSEEARANIRALDRAAALMIFDGLLRYARTGHGDVKVLQGEFQGRLRLRVGEYRVIFQPDGHILRILNVKNRKQAYR